MCLHRGTTMCPAFARLVPPSQRAEPTLPAGKGLRRVVVVRRGFPGARTGEAFGTGYAVLRPEDRPKLITTVTSIQPFNLLGVRAMRILPGRSLSQSIHQRSRAPAVFAWLICHLSVGIY